MAVSKGGSSQSSRTRVDPVTQDWINQIKRATETAAGEAPPGFAPGIGDIGQFLGGLFNPARTGIAALGGDAAAAGALMNPYQQQVIDATNADYDKSALLADRGVGDAATAAGAYGGSRHGVASGVMGANVERARNAELAGLRSTGFENSMSRAAQLASLGITGAQGLMGFDEYMRNAQMGNSRYRLDTLKSGLAGLPYGQDMRGKASQWGISGQVPFLSGSGSGGK